MGSLVLALMLNATPAPRYPEAASPVWEHKCLEFEWNTSNELETFANSMGLASWELVGFPKLRTLCFKRRRIDPESAEGKLRLLNDRMSKITLIYNEGRLGELDYKKRLEEIEAERARLLAQPEKF